MHPALKLYGLHGFISCKNFGISLAKTNDHATASTAGIYE